MTEHAAMLKAVLDAPDDDAPRLAYAEWSEAQGGGVPVARAELIRAQIALARMDPLLVEEGRAFLLQHRIFELIERYGSEWARPLPEWVDGFYFVRGFAGWVETSAKNFLQYGQRIFAAAPVQHLDLTGVRDVDESLFDSPLLANVRTLAMNRCGLHDLHVELLAASPHVQQLRWLSLPDNHLTLAAAEALAASPHMANLVFAEFGGNPVDPVEQLRYDSGIVVSSWRPPEGYELEERFGDLPWLHRDVVRNRTE